MPSVLTKNVSENSTLLFWEIEESLEELISLFKELGNSKEELEFIKKYKNKNRQKEWLSTRLLISQFYNEKTIVTYDDYGKPHLKNDKYAISISHSKEMVVVAISKEETLGVDVEFMSDKIGRIALKFLHEKEIENIDLNNDILKLYLHWCAKEALYKVHGKKKLNFINDLRIEPIDKNAKEFTGSIILKENTQTYQMQYLNHNNYIVVWTCNSKK